MSIEEQIRTIATDELETQLIELEKRLRNSMRQENRELKEQMDALGVQLEQVQARFGEFSLRIEKLEEDLSNRFGLVVKLRKYTLDQLMSEYKRLTGTMRPEQEETVENAEI
ncbi:MAG TPA: hypothetical protein VM050_02970 [Patescibacteria group bacterium]|nr:hypothetical protein [Patescibacteria group bacterium]